MMYNLEPIKDKRKMMSRDELKVRFIYRDESWSRYFYMIEPLPLSLSKNGNEPVGYQSNDEFSLLAEDRVRVAKLIKPIHRNQ